MFKKNDYYSNISFLYFRAYDSPDVMNLNKLCILAGKTCWILYVDILILGNILGVKQGNISFS